MSILAGSKLFAQVFVLVFRAEKVKLFLPRLENSDISQE